MVAPAKVYLIWYGDWTVGDMAIINDFVNALGGSPYYTINTTYNDLSGFVPNAITLSGSAIDHYSLGNTLAEGDIWSILASNISSGALPADADGVYFVLTASDVSVGAFCKDYCGWHTFTTILNNDIKFAFVGNPSTRCPSACEASTGVTPNGSAGADAVVSVIAHELEETTSDPHVNAWNDGPESENADKCAWTFGATYRTSNGGTANMRLGSRDYLIQQNWLNANGGGCVTSYTCPTVCPAGACNSIPDGCGGTIACGRCPAGATCSVGTCVRKCAAGLVDCNGKCVKPNFCF
jgi:hypothetical protein